MRIAPLVIAAAGIVVGAFFACSNVKSSDEKEGPVLTEAQMIKRGEYLVSGIGCDDCHSPKRMGPHGPEVIPETRFSGYPSNRPVVKPDTGDLKKGYLLLGGDLTSAVGPWGMSFSANITSDATGIGNWTEQNFLTAMRHGKSKGLDNGRDLLPPMPWYNFAKFTDEDLKAMFAYLKSTTPVANRVPAPLNPGQLAQMK